MAHHTGERCCQWGVRLTRSSLSEWQGFADDLQVKLADRDTKAIDVFKYRLKVGSKVVDFLFGNGPFSRKKLQRTKPHTKSGKGLFWGFSSFFGDFLRLMTSEPSKENKYEDRPSESTRLSWFLTFVGDKVGVVQEERKRNFVQDGHNFSGRWSDAPAPAGRWRSPLVGLTQAKGLTASGLSRALKVCS